MKIGNALKPLVKTSQILLFSCVSCAVSVVFAEGELSVVPTAREVNVNGRGIATLVFNVANRSGGTQEVNESIRLPEGWFLLSTTAPFLLAQGARDVRLIHVSVPRGISSGVYSVAYVLTSRRDRNIRSTEETIKVRIAGRSGMELNRVETPANLLSNEAYVVRFRLKNIGNSAVSYTLRVDDRDGYVTAVQPKQLVLAAGASGEVNVTGKIANQLRNSGSHHFVLIAKGGGKTVEERVNIPTVSRRPQGIGRYKKLYGQVALIYNQEQEGATTNSTTKTAKTQLALNLQGSVDAKSKHHIALALRNGHRSNQVNTQQDSHYHLGYWNNNWKVDLGHQGFSTSRLTGNSLSGTGALFQYKSATTTTKKKNSLKIRAFTGKSRAGTEEKITSSGLSVDYRFDALKFEVGGGLLNYQKQGDKTLQIASLKGRWVGEYFTLEAEIANDQNAMARFLDLTTQWKDIGFTLTHQRGDAGFQGAFKDSEVNYLGANWALNEHNQLNLSTRRSRNNLKNDNEQEIRANKEHSLSVTHRFDQDWGIEIGVGYRLRKNQDLRTVALTDQTVTTQFLSYKQSFESVDVLLTLETGHRKDDIKNTNTKGDQQQLVLNWKPSKQWNANATYRINQALNTSGKTTSASVRGSYRLDRRQNLSAYWQQTKNKATDSGSDNFGLNYAYQLNNRHRIEVNATHTQHQGTNNAQDYDDNTFRLKYVVPLEVPIRRRTNIGSVSGRVYFQDTQQPAANIILNLDGQYAVTDEQGMFYYPNILAKKYALSVDTSRLSGGSYTLGKEGSSLDMTLKPNEKKKLNIGLKQAARLRGRLTLYKKEISQNTSTKMAKNVKVSLVEDAGLGGLLMELQSIGGNNAKQSTHRRVSDQSGSFDFSGIPAGKWTLTLIDVHKIPKNFRAEKTNVQVDLVTGKEQDVQIRILPTEQTIQKQGPLTGFDVSG